MEIDIAQQFVTRAGGIIVENFSASADQIANPFRLVADLKWASGETGKQKKLTRRIEACRERRTEYIEITQWQSIIEYVSCGERFVCTLIRNYCEAIGSWNRTYFERCLSYYSKCPESAAHQLHQLI